MTHTATIPSRATPGMEYIRYALQSGLELHIEQNRAYLMPGWFEVWFRAAWRVVSEGEGVTCRWTYTSRGNVTVATWAGITESRRKSTRHKANHYTKHELYRAA